MAPAQNGVAKPGAKLRIFTPNEAFLGGAQSIECEWRTMFRKIYEAKAKARAPRGLPCAARAAGGRKAAASTALCLPPPPAAAATSCRPIFCCSHTSHHTLPRPATPRNPHKAQVDSNIRGSGPGCPQEELARAMSRNRCAARPQTPFARPPALGGSSAVPRPAAFAWS
jgi:hypothetical protein